MPGGLDIYKRVCTLMGLILNESLRGKKKKTPASFSKMEWFIIYVPGSAKCSYLL